MDPRTSANAALPRVSQRVLIVDDHVDSADIIAQALDARGHETRVAYEPYAALTLAADFQPDVAILDVNLPGMDGYELGAALRVILGQCRFIAMTGDAPGLNGLRSQWAGFDGYLRKPVALEALLGAVAGDSYARSSWPSGTFLQSTAGAAPLRGPSYRPQRERGRIDLDESPEVVRYWTTSLCCTEAQLRAAVTEVGCHADEVRAYLAK
ncbi:MAG: response regulator [Polyangiaceae bacterium]